MRGTVSGPTFSSLVLVFNWLLMSKSMLDHILKAMGRSGAKSFVNDATIWVYSGRIMDVTRARTLANFEHIMDCVNECF